MSIRWCIAIAIVASLVACREAEQLPHPFNDASFTVAGEDGGSIGQPCRQQAPACWDSGVAVSEAVDGGCMCRGPCLLMQPVPRCTGWEACTQLSVPLGDGGRRPLDAGVCLNAGAPNAQCSPEQCAELLVCARLGNPDAGETCRYRCNWAEDAGIEDAAQRDANPTANHCPPGQGCNRMNNDGGACFVP